MPNIFLYQILNYYTSREDLDPGFLILDNSANQRPDWYEYWPIRRFLLNERLDEDSFYGFLSPKFKHKTNMSASAAQEFVRQQLDTADVVLLSQSVHLPAYYSNIFQYGEAAHPGLINIATQFFQRIGSPTNLQTLITTSRNEVYSNFFIAKPRFWRAWFDISERLFKMAETSTDPLNAELCRNTAYRKRRNVQMKIFLMERIATWLIVRDPQFVVRARDPFIARSRIYKLPGAIVCDALKIAYLESGKLEYRDTFELFSRFGRLLSWQIRVGAFLGIRPITACLDTLSSSWKKAGQMPPGTK